MKSRILIIMFVAASMALMAQLPDWKMAIRAGGSGTDNGEAITRDALGNIYLAGSFSNTITLGSTTLISLGSTDFYVGKMDLQGNWLWAISAGGDSLDYATGIEVDAAGNIYVSGGFGSTASFGAYSFTASGYTDAFVGKLDANANWLWVKRAASSYACYGWVKLDSQGNVWFSGLYSGITSFGNTNLYAAVYDIFVSKLDNNGAWLWARRIYGPNMDNYKDLVFDSEGNAYLLGNYTSSLNLGTVNLVSPGGTQSFVAKLNTDGICLWAVSPNSLNYLKLNYIGIDNAGSLWVGGTLAGSFQFGNTFITSNGSDDLVIAKMDSAGNWLGAVSAGSSENETALGFAVKADGIYLAGKFYSSFTVGNQTLVPSGTSSMYVVKLDYDLSWLWAASSSSATLALVYGLCADNVGNVFMAGFFTGTMTVGGSTLASAGDRDIFLIKVGDHSDPIITVSGSIIRNDPPQSGIADATVQLVGFTTHSSTVSTDGYFSLTGVYSHEAYGLRINAPGFEQHTQIVEVLASNLDLGTVTLYETCYPPQNVSAYVEGITAYVNWTMQRDLLGYRVWRLAEGSENDESSWVLLTTAGVGEQLYVDNGWDLLPFGNYRWAVKAIYFDNRPSAAVLSNVLLNYAYHGYVTGVVGDHAGIPLKDVSIRSGESYTQTVEGGSYSLLLPQGNHVLRVSHPCAQALDVPVLVVTAMATTASFNLPEGDFQLLEDFEAYPSFTLSCYPWVVLDVDQDPSSGLPGYDFPHSDAQTGFMIFDPDSTTPPLPDAEAHGGSKFAASIPCQMLGNNDWLISPVVEGGGVLRFWARSLSSAGTPEIFRVGVSSGSTAPGDFIFLNGGQILQAPYEWAEYEFSLADWQGQSIRVGINCLSYRSHMFCLDDVTITSVTAIDDPLNIPAVRLLGVVPNPFRTTTLISYSLAKDEPSQMDIYNLRGQKIRKLLPESLSDGRYVCRWDGCDQAGKPVSQGVYFYRLNSGKVKLSGKILKLAQVQLGG